MICAQPVLEIMSGSRHSYPAFRAFLPAEVGWRELWVLADVALAWMLRGGMVLA